MNDSADGTAVTQPPRQVYYGDPAITLRESDNEEPRLELIIHRYGGRDNSAAPLDVAQITQLREALGAWLQDHKPRIGWMHHSVTYDLDATWWGRPGTPYFSLTLRYTGRSVAGVPMMKVHPEHPDYPEDVPMTAVLGATTPKAATWNPRCIGTAECQCSSCSDGPDGEPEIDQDYVDSLEQWDMERGEAYGTGLEPRGDQ